MTKFKDKTLISLTLISLIGSLFFHIYLTFKFYQLTLSVYVADSICNINQIFNCEAVSASPFAVILGIPIALLGFLTNFILLYFFLFTFYEWTKKPHLYKKITFSLSLFIACTSIIMGLISILYLDVYCIFCIFAYLASFITLLGCHFIFSSPKIINFSDLKSCFGQHREILFIFISIPLLSLIIHQIILKQNNFKEVKYYIEESVSVWNNSTFKNFDPNKGLILEYGKSPQHTIVEFSDFLCPHCKTAALILKRFVYLHSDVKLIYKPYPLDGNCNPGLPKGDNKRCELSYLVFCAEKIYKKGWDAHDWLFENQSNLYHNSIEKILQDITTQFSLNQTEIESCMQSEEIKQLVIFMGNEGSVAQISGTPSAFFDGKKLIGERALAILNGFYKKLKTK